MFLTESEGFITSYASKSDPMPAETVKAYGPPEGLATPTSCEGAWSLVVSSLWVR